MAGAETSWTIVNGLPMMNEGFIFNNKFKIFERSGWDDRVGAEYLAIELRKNKEVVLLIDDDSKQASPVKMKITFLKKVEDAHVDRLFLQMHSRGVFQGFCYVATFYRSGPKLQDCINYVKEKGTNLSHGSAGRLARDILKILEAAHGLGYLVRSLDPKMFAFDACCRTLFLSDVSTLQKDAGKLHLSVANSWVGGPHSAPLSFHSEGALTCRDEVEAMLYLLAEMVKGPLSWDGARDTEIEGLKRAALDTGSLFQGLPSQYGELCEEVKKMEPGEEVNYKGVERILNEIIKTVGGVTSDEDNFDFERDPTEDEIPHFVMEKVPKNTDG